MSDAEGQSAKAEGEQTEPEDEQTELAAIPFEDPPTEGGFSTSPERR